MEKTRPILYGVSDYAQIRKKNAWFIDIALAPRFDIAPTIAHAALIELKYLKAGDSAPAPDQLADIKAMATEQLDRYSSDPELAVAWRLKKGTGELGTGNGTVKLHRLVLVFHGGDCVLAEEA